MTSLAFDQPAAEQQVRKFSEDFVHKTLALSPVSATSTGFHEYQGVRLDEQLDDFSDAGIRQTRDFYTQSGAEIARLSKAALDPELKADLDILRLQIKAGFLEMDQLQSYRHNPTVYVELLGNALYTPFIQNYAPPEKRYAQITARLEKIPAFLEVAKRNLKDSPEIWNTVAQEENQGNIDLINQTIRPKISESLKPRFDTAAQGAVASLKAFNLYLKDDLSKRQSDWRLGTKNYAAKFDLTLATGDTPQQTLADAEAKMESIRQQMKTQAAALYPKYFPNQAVPSDLNTLVSQVLDKVAAQHSTKENYFDEAQSDLAETTAFVKDHHLLTLPARSNLQVIPTPEFMRGIYAVGGFSPAPPLEPQLGAFYWITPFTADMTADRVESKLREYNTYGLKILTIHEAMPGHYVQFEYANDIKPQWQGLLRAIFSNGPYVEGWAVYATQLLIEEGYRNTPEMQLTFGKQMLRVVSNTILDIRLQTMGMTDQQAIDLMIQQTFQEREEATKKLQRAKLSSCQLPTYFVGWRGWDQLRTDYRRKMGVRYSHTEFHERALREGALPLPVLRDLMLR